MLNPSVQVAEGIMNLRNGNLSYRGKKTIRTFNTCPFDSVFTVVAAMYADHDEIKSQINQNASKSEFLSMIQFMFSDIGKVSSKNHALLCKRSAILCSIFSGEEFECNLISVDCQGNSNYIIPKLLPNELYSYAREKQCDRCLVKITSNRCFVDVDIDGFDNQPIGRLNSYLLDSLIDEQPSRCECNGLKRIVGTHFSNFIMVDLTMRNAIKEFSLRDIPADINILGIKYSLKACIEFIPPLDENGIGHYVSHVHRRNARWETYDDKKAKVLRSSITKQMQGQVLFYVRIF